MAIYREGKIYIIEPIGRQEPSPEADLTSKDNAQVGICRGIAKGPVTLVWPDQLSTTFQRSWCGFTWWAWSRQTGMAIVQ